jgi:hypothetical protein
LAAGQASAQQWAEKMFGKLDHDFGTVARGADTVYRFEVTNIYKQDMTLTGVRSSCGCTSPSIENPIIKTHEKAYIVARFNTRTPPHLGQNSATLTVNLGAPYPAEVQLHVRGNIRSDVVFTPGAIEFGEVYEGSVAEQKIAVDYAGRSDWQIVDVTNDNDNFEVELNRTQQNGGRISYNLLVRLKQGTPAGYLKDQLTVVTNDLTPENQRIPLFASAHIRPEFSVTPEQLVLGDVKPGDKTTKKIIVRGREPFKIVDVSCGDDCFEFKTDGEVKPVHFVEVTFRASEAPGKFETPIRIVTDRGADRGPTCVASATVVEGKPAETAPLEAEPAKDSASTAAPKTDAALAAATE